MQTITTKYHGPSNVKGSRVSATASGSHKRVTLTWDNSLNSEDNHARAAKALMGGMGWAGKMIGGHAKDGMVWVFSDERYTIQSDRLDTGAVRN